MRPKCVDMHAHLELYPYPEAAIAECDMRVTATLTVTNTPGAFHRNKDAASKRIVSPRVVHYRTPRNQCKMARRYQRSKPPVPICKALISI